MVDISLFPRGDPNRGERSYIAPSATWLAPDRVVESLHWQYEDGKIFLGAIGDTLLGVRDDRHLITVGACNRSGVCSQTERFSARII